MSVFSSIKNFSLLDWLKNNTATMIIAVTVSSLVIFGYVEHLYYERTMPQLGALISWGAPITIEGIKFTFLLSTYSSALRAFGGGKNVWFHGIAAVIGIATSGYVLTYQYQEISHMISIWGEEQKMRDFFTFFVIISIVLEIRMIILISSK